MRCLKESKIYKNVFFLLCPLILGLILGTMGIKIKLKSVVLICIVLFISLMFFVILNVILKSMNNMKLLSKGEYNKAIQGFEGNIKKYERNKKIVNAMIYNIAICHYRKGEFIESKAYLDKIDSSYCDDNVKYGYFGLQASNLIFLEENISEAEEYFKKADQLLDTEEGYPIRAYLEGIKGNSKEVLRYIESYINKEKKKKVVFSFNKSLLLYDKFIYDIENNFHIGAAYLKLNEPKLAKEYFIKASKGQYENYFSKKAEEILNGPLNVHE